MTTLSKLDLIKTSVRGWLGAANAPAPHVNVSGLQHLRFLTDSPVAYQSAIEAAESYVSKLEAGDVGWLHSKPFDPTPGNPQYFRLMFDLLNILQVMQIPEQGHILEVGSGPGWVTEILLMLGFSVDALEPSIDLSCIAKERCAGLAPHYRHTENPRVRFHQSTLEEVDFAESSFDAVLFFDVLHHVVDEGLAFEKTSRFLKPGGCVGIVEGAWHPDFKELEAGLMTEMAKFGTLENPFSVDYLDYLLRRYGFIDLRRFVGVNGFFTDNQLSDPLRSFAGCPVARSNNVMARKPSAEELRYPGCAMLEFRTALQMKLVSGGINVARRVASVVVVLTNTGETLLRNRPSQSGCVTLALRQGAPDSQGFVECGERHLLAQTLIPGQSVRMQLVFSLPSEASLEGWALDGVVEGLFWISARGGAPCPLPCV